VRQDPGVRTGVACLGLLLAAALTGCGTSRTPPPDVATPQQPTGMTLASYPASGLALSVPVNWRAEQGAQPLVASIASGTALVAIWRYPRTEPLPRSARAYATAKTGLLKAAQARDKSLKVTRSKVIHFQGKPALEIVGTETVGGAPRMVRSTHIFRDRSEIVVEALAPVPVFASLDPTVFAPLLKSVRIKPLPSGAR
jgi:hypothetical protein